jgi:hypothetical protein
MPIGGITYVFVMVLPGFCLRPSDDHGCRWSWSVSYWRAFSFLPLLWMSLTRCAALFGWAKDAGFVKVKRKRCRMDFIERYLGFSPDHGDGSFEAMLLIALVTIITGIALGFFRKHQVRN